MKRSAIFLLVCAVVTWSACGGGSGSKSSQHTPSRIHDRVFVTNSFSSDVEIIDAAKNLIADPTFNISTGTTPTLMIPSPDKKTTLVVDRGDGSLFPIENSTETLISTATNLLSIGGPTESVALASDNKTGYAAVRNFNNGTGVALGAVHKFDYTTATVSATYQVPAARWLALNHAGNKLLVMSDVSDSVIVMDLTQTTPTQTPVPGFSRPVAAFFSTDDSTAFVVSCGTECGGAAQANVTELKMSTQTLGRTVAVSAARVATMNGSTMYVAGSPNGSGGTAQTVDTTAFTAGTPVTIGLGTKQVIKFLGSKVWIGAVNCLGTGCLTMWDPTGTTVKIDNPATGQNSKGDVTGFDLITSSNRMFVAEGGELRVYDTNLNEQATTMDIVGQAYDVLYVPQ